MIGITLLFYFIGLSSSLTRSFEEIETNQVEVGPIEPPVIQVGHLLKARAIAEFSANLFDMLFPIDGNLFVSPLSIHEALLMAAAGSDGETLKAIISTLFPSAVDSHFQAFELQKIYQAEKQRDQSPPLYDLANSIWVSDVFDVFQSYMDEVQTLFEAEAQSLDFEDPSSVDVINGWINKTTKGLIPKVLDKISPDSRLFLVNTVYFKQSWQYGFSEHQTRPQVFTPIGAAAHNCGMMQKIEKLHLAVKPEYKAVALPFEDTNAQMLIVLPTETGEDALERAAKAVVSGDTLARLQADTKEKFVDLKLPRFDAETNVKMKDILSAMGMGIAFSDSANFSKISDVPLKIQDVLHKTVLRVDENGVEAAAATVVDVGVTSVPEYPPGEPVPFVVDRPFAVALIDARYGLPIFTGVIRDVPHVEVEPGIRE